MHARFRFLPSIRPTLMVAFAAAAMLILSVPAVEAACGNNVKEAGEDCDGRDLGAASCQAFPNFYTGGILSCRANCRFDFSACTPVPSQDLGLKPTDNSRPEPVTQRNGRQIPDQAKCGNGVIDPTEICDGRALGNATCMSVSSKFRGGTLACNSQCFLDTSNCF